MNEYVELRGGGYYLTDTRIGLDAIVHRFKEGASPESIFQSFPMAGSLERIYGAIAYYLRNKEDVEAYLTAQSERIAKAPVQPGSEELVDKLRRAKQESLSR